MKAGKFEQARWRVSIFRSWHHLENHRYKWMDNDKLIHLITIRCSDQSSHHAYYLSETIPTCGKKYKNRFDFCRHKKYCGSNVKVPCLHCDKLFATKDAMKANVRKFHSEAAKRKAEDSAELQSQTKIVGTLKPNAVFSLVVLPSSLSKLFIAVWSPNLVHQHWGDKETPKCPNHFDWDCSPFGVTSFQQGSKTWKRWTSDRRCCEY